MIVYVNLGCLKNAQGNKTSKLLKGRLLKVGAAAILSVGILAACGEYGGDDIIIDDSNEEILI